MTKQTKSKYMKKKYETDEGKRRKTTQNITKKSQKNWNLMEK